MRRPGRLFALAALAAATSACGTTTASGPSGASGEDGGAPRLARAELVSRANAVCTRRARALEGLAKPQGTAGTRRFFAAVAAIERAEFVGLARLRPPRAQERRYLRLLAASLALARIADRFHAALLARDVHARRRALADADRLSESYDRAARTLGLACRQTV